MGIFKRLKTITKANINDFLDGLEDPVAMLNEYTRELEDELAKGEQALAHQIFTEKKQAALIKDTKGLIEKRTRQAKLGIEHGDESIAKLAVEEKLIHEKQLHLYQEQYETLKGQTQILTEKLNQLKQSYNELLQKKLLLASRANVAQSLKQIQKASFSFETNTIARGVARAEERIMLMEARAQASNHTTGSLAAHEAAFRNHIRDEELEQELEKLRPIKETL